jgi:hypothetical protein
MEKKLMGFAPAINQDGSVVIESIDSEPQGVSFSQQVLQYIYGIRKFKPFHSCDE